MARTQKAVVNKQQIAKWRRQIRNSPWLSFAWWDAALSWGDAVPNMVLLHPRLTPQAFMHRMQRTLTAKIHRRGIQHVQSILRMRSGEVRQLLRQTRDLSIGFNRTPFLPSAAQVLDNVTLAVELWLGPNLTWHSRGRRKTMFLPSNKSRLRQWAANAERRERDWTAAEAFELYWRHPSADVARRLFVRFAPQIAPMPSHPLSLTQLGRVRNVELRQALVQVFGVKQSGKPIQKDSFGELYALDNVVRVLHVTCPSTKREFWLGVPAVIKTAKQGVLWSFSFTDGVSGSGRLKLLKEA